MLYFNIWDRLMGTNAHDYEALVEESSQRARLARAARKARRSKAGPGLLPGSAAAQLQ